MKEQTEKITKKITGGALGAALGLSLSLLFLPLEVQAATPCDEESSCVGYDDSDVEHNHKITLQGETFSGGTAMKNVEAKGTSTIEGGTFQGQVRIDGNATIKNGTFQRQVDVDQTGSLTIDRGSFSNIMVYGDATIKGGTFGGGFEVNSNSGCAHINGGTFESGVHFNSSTGGSITGGVFKGDVYLGAYTTVTGGTFLGRVLGRNDNSYTFPADTYHTINFEYSDGTSGKQLVVGNNSISVNPNGGEWLDEATKEEYIFGRSVNTDLTLIEVARASEGGEGAEAERLPEGSHTTCEYEWVTVREAGAGVDGEEWYQCKHCGRVESVQIIPAASYQTARLYEAIGKAQESETVTYDLGNFHTITDTLLTTLQNRSDVTLVLTFTYQNRCYETTFPKGTDYTELLEDEDFFYGLLGLNGRSGIVTQDVTP